MRKQKEENIIMKLRKVLALTLAAAMTFSLVGCGGSSDEAATEAPATEETAEEAPADDAAEEAPATEE